ncbi:hypothetical protein [Pseudonocardia sp. GCM10023141]|uniref:hypothetical protein n=1 Tax=Pseudonocardia sp. GCM10023141 TaxID=3252653 RepID=UPI003623BD7F
MAAERGTARGEDPVQRSNRHAVGSGGDLADTSLNGSCPPIQCSIAKRMVDDVTQSLRSSGLRTAASDSRVARRAPSIASLGASGRIRHTESTCDVGGRSAGLESALDVEEGMGQLAAGDYPQVGG